MKTSKAAAKGGGDASAAASIAPEALSHLADRLKFDLGNSDQQTTQSKRKRKGKQTDQEATDSKNVQANGGPVISQQVKPKKAEKAQTSTGARKGSKSSAIVNSEPKNTKSQRKQLHTPEKARDANKPSLKDNSKRPTSSAGAKTKTKPSKKALEANKTEASSLLDEILALGGSKEDLELVESVDTDEDILGPSQTPKAKSGDKSVISFNF
jgi:hypothetical protein